MFAGFMALIFKKALSCHCFKCQDPKIISACK